MQRIRLKRTHPDAELPVYKTEGSAGFDLAACETVEIPPHQVRRVALGWAMEVPPGHQMEIRPRSGISLKTAFLVVHGTVDSDYRGEIAAIVRNESNNDETVHAGDRIAQGVLTRVELAVFKEVADLTDTVRGAAGFGSTGIV